MRDYPAIAKKYALDVVSGVIPACKYVQLACNRQLQDLERDWEYTFDKELASRICRFVELLPHIKGEWAQKKLLITLEPAQIFAFTTVFGWVDKDGYRRFKTVYKEVPRKNAKSTETSALGLYLTSADGEEGAEVYSAATTREQARIVWNDAKRMADRSLGLRQRFGVDTSAHSVFVEQTASTFKPLSRDQGGNHDGLNVSGGLIDELHAHKTRELFDVIDTATGSRRQPLIWLITTAGFNRAGICYEMRDYALRVLKGVAKDEEFFAIIYTVDDDEIEDMDRLLSDPEIWKKANPNWGISVNPEDLARKARKAREMVSARNNFLTKHLNIWVNADTAWMDMAAWDRQGDKTLNIADFEGLPCYKGIDLASKIDIASEITLFEKVVDGETHYYCFDRHWLPEETIETSGNSQYQGWEQLGLLNSTPGNVIDFDYIEEQLLDDTSRFHIEEIGFDPFQATQFSVRMHQQGLPMIEVRPTVLNFSEPMKELEALIVSGRLHHTGSPILAWMISNVVCHLDKKDNVYPNKEFPQNKIDGVVALIMALNRALLRADDGGSFDEFLSNPIIL